MYEVHNKNLQFNCCNNDCTNILCSDCLVYSDENSDYMPSALFYCHKYIAKAKASISLKVVLKQMVLQMFILLDLATTHGTTVPGDFQ